MRRSYKSLAVGSALLLASLAGRKALAQATIFSDDFGDTNSGSTTLLSRGWYQAPGTAGGAGTYWNAAATPFAGAPDTTVADGSGNDTKGVNHAVATQDFVANPALVLTMNVTFATNNTSGITSANRFYAGVNHGTTDTVGYWAILSNPGTTSSGAYLAINEGGNLSTFTTHSAGTVSLSSNISPNTYYTLSLTLGSTSATATLIPVGSATPVATTSVSFSSLNPTNFDEAFLDQRNGITSTASELDYVDSYSLTSNVPEPASATMILGGVWLGLNSRTRRKTKSNPVA